MGNEIFGNQLINRNGKTINKFGTPIIREIYVDRYRVKYMFWKVTILNDFEERWDGADREIMKDSVEYSYLRALIKRNGWSFGENLTVWDGDERKVSGSKYWYSTGNEGDNTIDYKIVSDLYMGEWAIVDENGVPFIDKKYREFDEKLRQNLSMRNNVEKNKTLYDNGIDNNKPSGYPQIQRKEGNVYKINYKEQQNNNNQNIIKYNPREPQQNNNQKPNVRVIRNF